MSVKDVLQQFTKSTETSENLSAEHQEKIKAEIESLLIKTNRCFVDVILPSVFSTEKDLHEADFWNQLNIGQSTALSSGKPNIKEVTLYFYPERVQNIAEYQSLTASAFRATFTPTGDMRKIVFTIHFPQRLSAVQETEAASHNVDDINPETVDRFLEKFVKGAVDVYSSDRFLR